MTPMFGFNVGLTNPAGSAPAYAGAGVSLVAQGGARATAARATKP